MDPVLLIEDEGNYTLAEHDHGETEAEQYIILLFEFAEFFLLHFLFDTEMAADGPDQRIDQETHVDGITAEDLVVDHSVTFSGNNGGV